MEITLLGGFAASVDGVPVEDGAWRLRKARDLVKLLALAPGRTLHREQAMDALWRDRDPRAAANNLYQAVHAARRALGAAAIDVREEVLRLDAAVDVDLAETAAEEARRSGTPSAHRAALALLEGDLLPENRYDDWAEERRESLAALREELTEALRRIGAVDGLRGLPVPTSSFVGREHELADLRTAVERVRLVTLTGTGGAGKTRLALELARTVEPAFADGAAVVELADVSDPGAVVDAVAGALDVRALPGRTSLDAVAEFLATRSLLLVVDNCEHVLPAAAGVVELVLRAAPRVTVVATSREPLHVPDEVVFRVPSLAVPDPERIAAPGELERYASVRLFAARAAAAAPGFAVDEENAADVARICFRLDGLPLALELAAGRMGALTPRLVAERLDDRFQLLRAGSGGAPTRQQTLAATLQWSHELLDEAERTLFRRLAVFAGGFELQAVEAVCGVETSAVADLLARLVEKSLVATDGAGGTRRYHLLESMRLFAHEQLAAAGESADASLRHAHWALALATEANESPALDAEAANFRLAFATLLRRDPDEALRLCVALRRYWLRRIDLREANASFTAAFAATRSRDALRAEALLAAASLDSRGGELQRGLDRANEALELATELGDPYLHWRALQFLGDYSVVFVDPATADAWYEQARALAAAEGFAAEEALGAYSVGVARWAAGDADAVERLEHALELLAALPASARRIPAPFTIGEIRTREKPGVPVVLEETLQPYTDIGCAAAHAFAQASLAAVVRSRGDPARAAALLAASAEAFERLGDDTGRASVLVRQGYLALDVGEPSAARERFAEALELRRTANDRRGIGLALTALALAATALGEWARAETLLAEAQTLFRRAGDRWGYANALWRAADIGFARGDLDAAEAALVEARAVLAETGVARWLAHTAAALAEAAARRGDADRARELMAEAHDLYASAADGVSAAAADARFAAAAKATQRRGRRQSP